MSGREEDTPPIRSGRTATEGFATLRVGRLLLTLVAVIFLVEFSIMLAIHSFLFGLPDPLGALLDGGILIIVLIPTLYVVVYRPFRSEMAERLQAEQALRASEANYRAIFDAANDAIFVHDANTGRILDVNRKMTELYGYTAEEARDRTVEELSAGEPPFTQEEALRRLRRAAEGQPQLFEWLARDRWGRTFWVEVNLRRATIGGQDRLLAIVRDVGERKRAEQERDRLLAELRQANEKLVELARQREDYARMISHDLRSPLTSILGSAAMLQRRLADKGQEREARMAGLVLTSARRLDSMIQELVESTRLESGILELHKELADPCGLLREVVQGVGTPEDRGRIQLECAEGLPELLVDRERMERAVVNLITNALKYSPPTSPVVVKAERTDGEVQISVSDRGVGIAPEELPHIFDRFYRAAAGRKGQGLGLGLYITRLMVEAHGGRVGVESRLGEGSTFRITLPIHGEGIAEHAA